MIRVTASRGVRSASAFAGAAGLLLLAGCAGAAETPAAEAPAGSEATMPSSGGQSSGGDAASAYADGTYTAEVSYQSPETAEKISVTLALVDGRVTAVEVTGDPQAPETERYQGEFIAGIADVVEGRPIDELEVDRVAGSSLTSGGFNQAVEAIKEQAAG